MTSVVSRSIGLLLAGALALGTVPFAAAENSSVSVDIKIQKECAHLQDLTERASCEAKLRARLSQRASQDVRHRLHREFGDLLQGLHGAFRTEMKAEIKACEKKPEAEREQCMATIKVKIEEERTFWKGLRKMFHDFLREIHVAFKAQVKAGVDVCIEKPAAERSQCFTDLSAMLRARVDAAINALKGL